MREATPGTCKIHHTNETDQRRAPAGFISRFTTRTYEPVRDREQNLTRVVDGRHLSTNELVPCILATQHSAHEVVCVCAGTHDRVRAVNTERPVVAPYRLSRHHQVSHRRGTAPHVSGTSRMIQLHVIGCRVTRMVDPDPDS